MAEVHSGCWRCTDITRPKRRFSHAMCRSTDGIGQSPAETTYRLRPTRNPTFFVVSLCILETHEDIEKPRKMALDGLEILYICIHKPFQVRFHRINTFPSYFIYLTKNANIKENAVFWISKYMKYHLYLHWVQLSQVMFISAPLHCNAPMWCCDAVDRNRISHIPPGRL